MDQRSPSLHTKARPNEIGDKGSDSARLWRRREAIRMGYTIHGVTRNGRGKGTPGWRQNLITTQDTTTELSNKQQATEDGLADQRRRQHDQVHVQSAWEGGGRGIWYLHTAGRIYYMPLLFTERVYGLRPKASPALLTQYNEPRRQ
jgi:hypothetical protein